MNPLRQMLHQQIAQALGCVTDDEYRQKKDALLEYLRRVQPAQSRLEGGRKRAFERMAEMEGITVEEKLDPLPLSFLCLPCSLRLNSSLLPAFAVQSPCSPLAGISVN